MFNSVLVHARNLVVRSLRSTCWENDISHLGFRITDNDHFLVGFVWQGLDFIGNIVVLRNQGLRITILLTVELTFFNLLATFSLMNHIKGTVYVLLYSVNKARILFEFTLPVLDILHTFL